MIQGKTPNRFFNLLGRGWKVHPCPDIALESIFNPCTIQLKAEQDTMPLANVSRSRDSRGRGRRPDRPAYALRVVCFAGAFRSQDIAFCQTNHPVAKDLL